MNPRDTDAIYDAILSVTRRSDYTQDARLTSDYIREIISNWKSAKDDSTQRTAEYVWVDEHEHAWMNDIFKQEPTSYTEYRDRYPGFAPKRQKRKPPVMREDLQAGDTAELDGFLAGFLKQEVPYGNK